MTRYYKRLGAGKRTKLSAAPIGQLQGRTSRMTVSTLLPPTKAREKQVIRSSETHKKMAALFIDLSPEKKLRLKERFKQARNFVFGLSSSFTEISRRFDLRKPEERKQYIDLLRKAPVGLEDQEALMIVENNTPFFYKGQPVFKVDFNQHPLLKRRRTPAICLWNFVFMDSNIPDKFQRIILDHEVRELLLRSADYKPIKIPNQKKGREYSRIHRIARQRELAYAQKTGNLESFLDWLKKEYPHGYAERMKILKKQKREK